MPPGKTQKTKYFGFVLRLAAGLAIIFFLFKIVPLEKIYTQFKQANLLFLILAVLCFFVLQLFYILISET